MEKSNYHVLSRVWKITVVPAESEEHHVVAGTSVWTPPTPSTRYIIDMYNRF
jgi:hypothetical protein